MSDDTFNGQTIDDLRVELKRWERDFAKAHDGRKPSREDIKQDGTIAARYSLFNRLTRPQTISNVHTTPQKRVRRIRPALEEQSANVPSNAIAATPRKDKHEAFVEQQEAEDAEPTPAHIRCALGPTPQKDGFVLSIFDLKTTTPSQRSEKKDSGAAIAATPSKDYTSVVFDAQTTASIRSESKRFFLDAFAGTPMKRKSEEDHRTPSTAKRQFATPAFLRRESTLEAIREDEDDGERHSLFTSKKPGRRKGMARSFSAILANLRKNENDRMDDEWDILQELEAEEAGIELPKPVSKTITIPPDIEAIEMPLGPDQAVVSEDDASDAAEPTRKQWKKKGLKRQTKRVNMKPVLHAPKKAAEVLAAEGAHGTAETTPDGTSIVKKAVRKVNEAAHMNFRKLNIKNKNSKAKGRFGKKR